MTVVAPVLRATHVRRSADQTFALFTEQIGAWWPLPTHGLYGERSAGVSFERGLLVERAVDGGSTVWGEVLVWEPPKRLSLSWHPGRGADAASTVEVTFIPDEDGTRVELRHDGWQAFGADALQRRSSYVGPNAWGYVLDHFADLGDRAEAVTGDPAGDPGSDPGIDLAGVRERYATFHSEAAAGGFGPPETGEWSAEQVVAHIATNDDLMSAVCRALIHQVELPRFDNADSNDPMVLNRLVDACEGDLARLTEVGRTRAEQLVLLLGRLDAQQRDALVHAHLADHGQLLVDEPRPWWALAVGVQTGFHLPLHTEQLRALRGRPSG